MHRSHSLLAVALVGGCVVAGEPGSTDPEPVRVDPAAEPGRPQVHARATPRDVEPRALTRSQGWISGAPATERAGCEDVGGPQDKKSCTFVASSYRFRGPGLDFCRAVTMQNSKAGVRCLIATAEQTVPEDALEVCSSMPNPDDGVDCLEVIVGRRIAAADAQGCRARRKPSQRTRCLARATDYAFDPRELYALAEKAVSVGKNHPSKPGSEPQITDVIATLADGVAELAPKGGKPEKVQFLLNFAGSAMGHYRMLYCSAHEYILVFGTPLATNGYSGKYRFEVNDWVVTGNMQTHRAGHVSSDEYAPGTWARLFAGQSKIYSSADGTYMLEYARGPIPSAYKFGIVTPTRSISRNKQNRRAQIATCADGLAANERARRSLVRTEAKARTELRQRIVAEVEALNAGARL